MSAEGHQRRQRSYDVAEEVARLALAEPYREALATTIRRYAADRLAEGYPREALLEDFEHVRSSLEAEDRDDEEDDVVVGVMDALVG